MDFSNHRPGIGHHRPAAVAVTVLAVIAATAGLITAEASTAAGSSTTCSGTGKAPGTLTGAIAGNVVVSGVCEVNAGAAKVSGSITVSAGGVLIAAFAHNDKTMSGSSSLSVGGNVVVDSGASAALGCKASSFPCLDDMKKPTLSSRTTIGGTLVATDALGVVVHSTKVANVSFTGGGGGLKCKPTGIFAQFKSPPYFDIEDSTITGSLTIKDLKGCYLGVIRDKIGKSATLTGNQLADPDAIEFEADHIGGDLSCTGNSMVWDSAEAPHHTVYPRILHANHVKGKRSGQCVTSPPLTKGGTPGTVPF